VLQPEADDVAQEVALQRLMGRHVTSRIVRRRMSRAEARRAEVEREYVAPTSLPPIDPARFPLLHDKLIRRLPVVELLRIHGCHSRSTLAARFRDEAARLLEER